MIGPGYVENDSGHTIHAKEESGPGVFGVPSGSPAAETDGFADQEVPGRIFPVSDGIQIHYTGNAQYRAGFSPHVQQVLANSSPNFALYVTGYVNAGALGKNVWRPVSGFASTLGSDNTWNQLFPYSIPGYPR